MPQRIPGTHAALGRRTANGAIAARWSGPDKTWIKPAINPEIAANNIVTFAVWACPPLEIRSGNVLAHAGQSKTKLDELGGSLGFGTRGSSSFQGRRGAAAGEAASLGLAGVRSSGRKRRFYEDGDGTPGANITLALRTKTSSGVHRNSTAGLTFIELIIVVTIIGLLIAIAIPNSIHARDNARLHFIYNNLRRIEAAKTQYALDAHQTNGAPVQLDLLTNYFRGGIIPDVIHETYLPNAIGIPAQANLPPGVPLGPYLPGSAIPSP
jgi:type II secretory pathway pseudopilin PulG